MVRSIVGVIVGYIVMFILQVAILSVIYSMAGLDALKLESFDPSIQWIVMLVAVIFAICIIAGLVCALIARGGKAPLALAVVVLVLGMAASAVAISKETQRISTVPAPGVHNITVTWQAQSPWLIFLTPVIEAIGVVIGGKIKRQSPGVHPGPVGGDCRHEQKKRECRDGSKR
jgi:MFS family permease